MDKTYNEYICVTKKRITNNYARVYVQSREIMTVDIWLRSISIVEYAEYKKPVECFIPNSGIC